ncbi:MAG TPA: carboxypeptidase-like regulatory domain-containing protein [Pyrinomonadaceae bacterium]|jgi:hypothetical protein
MKSRLIFQTVVGVILLSIVFSMTLSARSAATYITGTVTKFGRPLPSVWVIISQGGYEKGRSLTGDDGKYYLGNLSDGVYKIEVYRGKLRLAEEQVSLPADGRHNIATR